ncbi:putative immunity protein [Gordonia sp. NPDC003425]
MSSIQTLSDPERRTLARWAICCAERVLPMFEADSSSEELIRDGRCANACLRQG